MNNRTTGYNVWAYGECWWHRTLAAAERRFDSVGGYCPNHRQIIECATGLMIRGIAL